MIINPSELVLFCLAGIAMLVAYRAIQVGILAISINKKLQGIT
jgi:hypothetical protein